MQDVKTGADFFATSVADEAEELRVNAAMSDVEADAAAPAANEPATTVHVAGVDVSDNDFCFTKKDGPWRFCIL